MHIIYPAKKPIVHSSVQKVIDALCKENQNDDFPFGRFGAILYCNTAEFPCQRFIINFSPAPPARLSISFVPMSCVRTAWRRLLPGSSGWFFRLSKNPSTRNCRPKRRNIVASKSRTRTASASVSPSRSGCCGRSGSNSPARTARHGIMTFRWSGKMTG